MNPWDLATRFWAKVDKNGPVHSVLGTRCWLWTGCCDRTGHKYGRFRIGGRKGKTARAHRVSWFLTYGKWPEPKALHLCDNPPCVRPDHMFEGDQLANVADCVAKRRTHGGYKLTEQDVLTIRAHYALGTVSQYKLAQQFGVAKGTIAKITENKVWRNVLEMPGGGLAST